MCGAADEYAPPLRLFYCHYHDLLRLELAKMREAVSQLQHVDVASVAAHLSALRKCLLFLEQIFSIHSSMEDEVIYPALDSKVKNVTSAYSMEHEDEERLFEQFKQLLASSERSSTQHRAGLFLQLACKAEEVLTTLSKHLAKEEEQVYPLILKHLTRQEQASLMSQLVCCIPITAIDSVLTWLLAGVPLEEQQQLVREVETVVSNQLLLQLLVTWLSQIGRPGGSDEAKVKAKSQGQLDCEACQQESPSCTRKGQHCRQPLKHIEHLHSAIRSALDAFICEVEALQESNAFAMEALAALDKHHRFLRAVCSFHCASEDAIILPAVRRLAPSALPSLSSCEADHAAEGELLEELGRLLHQMRASARRGAKEASVLCASLLLAAAKARQLLTVHMDLEERAVLPALQAALCLEEQRSMVWGTLQSMPLRLLEKVLPWLAGQLSQQEASEMVADWQLAAGSDDKPLVDLLSSWAAQAHASSEQVSPAEAGPEPAMKRQVPGPVPDEAALPQNKRSRPEHSHERHASADDSSVPVLSKVEPEQGNPIDHIFQFHKAICRDLRTLEADASALVAELEGPQGAWVAGGGPSMQAMEGKFRFLRAIYTAHSQIEDEVVFPALEVKEALTNVSHAYTLDHQQEAQLLVQLEQTLEALKGSRDLGKAQEQARTLQRLSAATRATLEQHVRAEEQELWPLFAEHFSHEEQQHIVGKIVGRTGAEALAVMIPWVTGSFTAEEQANMLDSMRVATRKTGFDQWLEATLPSPLHASRGVSPEGPVASSSSAPSSPEVRNKGLQDVAQYLQEKGRGVSGSSALSAADGHFFRPGWEDIFRMNQKQLEDAARTVGTDPRLDEQRRAYLMQHIMTSRYIVAQQSQRRRERAQAESAAAGVDVEFTGCRHYARKCQVVAPCCQQTYACQHCHDEAEDHSLETQAVQAMQCMACGETQPPAGSCSACGTKLAAYYCGICHLWDNTPGKSIYHCPFCNLCRLGRGLGVDSCHCMDCNTCMHLSEFAKHKCKDLSACPVCTGNLVNSSLPYRELPCGHFMHSHCFSQYTRYKYTCPICLKSLGDLRVYFGMLDSILSRDASAPHGLPTAYSATQEVYCNDCERTCQAPFHFVYHKCLHCSSYNTRVNS